MTFIFQQPGTAKLLEAIDAAAKNANSGGGVFAFASKGGIDAFFARPNVLDMLKHKRPFHIIVGVDAITNAEALLCLGEKRGQFPTLKVNVFFHEHPSSTFHPKFSWFKIEDNLKLVTGSGNMTRRGLGKISAHDLPPGNWEAFSVQSLTGNDATTIRKTINEWLNEQGKAGTLHSIDDKRVQDRAMSNGLARYSRGPTKPKLPVKAGAPIQDVNVVPLDGVKFETPEVLLRELPKNRPGQADVGRATLKEFFGYEEGIKTNIFVQHVTTSNELGSPQKILLFVNKSRNYRLELSATDLPYEIAEDDGRMLLIATKLDRRSFRYTVLPVTAPEYVHVTKFLGKVKKGKSRAMREKRVSPEELREMWPTAPSNLLPHFLQMPEP